MILLIATMLFEEANAASLFPSDAAHAAEGDISQVELEALARIQAEVQVLQAERDALRAQCAKACVPVVAPAPKPKTTTSTKPAPKPVATPVVPNAEIVVLREEIRVLRERIAALPAPPPPYNDAALVGRIEALERRPVATNTVVYQPTVEHKTTVYRASGTRIHYSLAESVIVAPPLPGSDLVATDETDLFGRVEWNISKDDWIAMSVIAGYGFAMDATAIKGLLGYTRNLGDGVDLNVGVGPSYRCTAAFSDGPLCNESMFGGEARVGIAFRAVGPLNVEAYAGGGHWAVDSKIAGPGYQTYAGGGLSVFVGTVGRGSTVKVP